MMKKNIILALCVFSGLLFSCEPVVDDKPLGGVVDESKLNLEVHATTEGGNQIVMINNTKGVGSYWDYVIGRSAADRDTVLLPFLGEQTITFTGLCDGGTVTTTRKVNVTHIDHAVAPEWELFAGNGAQGKKWTWDNSVAAVYGTGGYLTEFIPDWTSVALNDVEDKDGYMVFDLNGAPNFTRYAADGTVVEKGTFAFNMSSTKNNPDDGSQWSIGTLTLTGATVLSGHIYGMTAHQQKFDILTLDDNHLVLCAAPEGTAAWDNGTFWIFKRKI